MDFGLGWIISHRLSSEGLRLSYIRVEIKARDPKLLHGMWETLRFIKWEEYRATVWESGEIRR